MRKALAKELVHFKTLSYNAQDLIKSFIFFEIGGIVANIFAGAYIFSKRSDTTAVALYYLASFVMIPIFFYVNGWLLKRWNISRNFALGTFLIGLSPLVLVLFTDINNLVVVSTGIVSGIGMGMYWSNRNYLSKEATSDEDRNYFFSLSGMLLTVAGIIVPILAGLLIEFAGSAFGNRTIGYIALMIIGLVSMGISIYILRDNNFETPKIGSLLLRKPTAEWQLIRVATFFHSFRHGILLFFPTIIVLTLVGSEGSLGSIESIAALIGAMFTYAIGKKIKAGKRLVILLVGVILLSAGSISFAVLYSAIGALIFVVLLKLAGPQLFTAVSGVWLKGIEDQEHGVVEKNNYKYFCDIEAFIAFGRVFGAIIVIILVQTLELSVALRLVAIVILLSQILVYFFIRQTGKYRA